MGYQATVSWIDGLGFDDQARPGLVTYQVPYVLEYDGSGDKDPLEMRNAYGLPARGDLCPFDPSCVAIRRRWSVKKDSMDLAVCVVEFTSDVVGEIVENPLLRPIRYSYRSAPWQRPIDRDIDGEPIVNSYGDKLLNIPPADDSRPIIVINRNLASFDLSTAIQYQDAVNSDSFLGADPGQLKIKELSAEPQTEGVYSFWAFTAVIEARREGWKLQLLDAGLYQTGGSGGKPKAITTDQGVDVRTPVFLDGSGNVLPAGGDPVKLEFEIYQSLPFSFLVA